MEKLKSLQVAFQATDVHRQGMIQKRRGHIGMSIADPEHIKNTFWDS